MDRGVHRLQEQVMMGVAQGELTRSWGLTRCLAAAALEFSCHELRVLVEGAVRCEGAGEECVDIDFLLVCNFTVS